MLFSIKLVLRRYRFFHTALHIFHSLVDSSYRDDYRSLQKQLESWKQSTNGLMEAPLGDGSKGGAVFFGWSKFEYVLAESVVRKAFDYANFGVCIISEPTPANRAVYKTLGAEQIRSFTQYCSLPRISEAKGVLLKFKNFSDLVAYQYRGVAVGKYVSSTLMRRTRRGKIDIKDAALQKDLVNGLAASIAAVRGAIKMLAMLKPKIVVLVDRGYTPYGEVFDACVNHGVQVVTWNVAHRDNTIMLKRYNKDNRLAHPSSLSCQSWSRLNAMDWNESAARKLQSELADSYDNGEWYGEVGTQFGKRNWDKEEITHRLGLAPDKKTVVIYAHIFWDATFFWGEDLFRDYEDWFVQTVRAACGNDKLNWLIKVHPANLVKDKRDGVNSDPSELIALREQIGDLPDHVKVIPADSELTTLSLFKATDYCLTVRGTVGIEAALLGKTVLTAGTGRYDNYGFTCDFNSTESYLTALAELETYKQPNRAMREKAARYGYGIFLCRPVRLDVFSIGFKRDATASLQVKMNAKDVSQLRAAPELTTVAEWLHCDDEDYMCNL